MTRRPCQHCGHPLPWWAPLVGFWTCDECVARMRLGGTPLTPEGRRRIEEYNQRHVQQREVDEVWQAKQALAHPSRYYGEGGTFHGTTELDVEIYQGRVVAVWYRCQMLPFRQREVDPSRAQEMDWPKDSLPRITGVEVLDPERTTT